MDFRQRNRNVQIFPPSHPSHITLFVMYICSCLTSVQHPAACAAEVTINTFYARRCSPFSESELLYGWQSVSQSVRMSWRRAHFVDVWPDIASFSSVWVWNLCPVSVERPLWREVGSVLVCPLYQELLYGWQSVRMSWCRAHSVDVWPDIASFSRVWVWNLLSCLCGAPSLTRGRVCPCVFLVSVRVRVTLRLTVSQYVLVSSPLCGRLTRYCFLFKSLGQEFVVLPLWGALSDERPGLSFVSHNLAICLCVHLLFTFLSFTYLPYTLYNTYNIYKASFSPGSIQPYYSFVAQATTAV
jgi:hypothetical protein